nr:class I SAM-dependent methyltransferase [Rossellomorea marisflavi]
MKGWDYRYATFDVDEAEELPAGAIRYGPWSGHRLFAYDLVRYLAPACIVELGTQYGTSFFSFCQAVKDGEMPSICHAVDTWEGDPHAGYYGDDVYAGVKAVTEREFPGIGKLLRKTFDEALEEFEDGSIDLLHIDGYHTYEAVSHDYTTWLPKLSENGVVLFHDTYVRGRDFGVYKFWAEQQGTPHIDFTHSNGLGVLFPKGISAQQEHMLIRKGEMVEVYRGTDRIGRLRRNNEEGGVEPSMFTAYLYISDSYTDHYLHIIFNRLMEKGIDIVLCDADASQPEIDPKHPRVYVSIGEDWEEFKGLNSLPLEERRRWIHVKSGEEIEADHLFHCWLKRTDPLPEGEEISIPSTFSDRPLVSVFTAAYRSGNKIRRPYESLLKQTYTNWEWVIVDDSGDEDETYQTALIGLDDSRVRRYRPDGSSGYIGAVKRYAASLCTGEILVEVDHDDELTEDCLEKIVSAFQANPEAGFAYGDCTEVHADNLHAHWYGWDSGYGYNLYYRVWIHKMKRWQNVNKHTALNGTTIRHLVGLPNHPRAWRRDCYHLIGGHREELLVADDYDLLVRTFLSIRVVAIPDLLYIQYRNAGGSNTTFTRNKQIQLLVQQLYLYYGDRIRERLESLGLPREIPYDRIWKRKTDDAGVKTAHLIHEREDRRSLLFPIPHEEEEYDHTLLLEALREGLETGFSDHEIIIAGRIPHLVETYAANAPMGAIRWWPMEVEDDWETCLRYATYMASCKEKVVMGGSGT